MSGMRMSMGMQARQIQTQKLAPRMIQSMEILQLPLLALQERIEQEMNENPLLEQQEAEPVADTEEEPVSADTRSEDERELVVNDEGDNSEDFERLQNMISELPDTFDDSFRRSSNRIQEDLRTPPRPDGQCSVTSGIAERFSTSSARRNGYRRSR